MKVYTQQFACETPVQNRFYCPPNSMFKVGVKVLKGGEELSGVTLSSGGQALSPDEDKYFGWTTWTIQSQGPGSKEYVVGASGTEQKFKIQQVASDGTVFDVDVQGNVPADVATQGYVQDYVAGEISDLATQEETEAQLSAKRGLLDLAYGVSSPDVDAEQMGIRGWEWTVDGLGAWTFIDFHENYDDVTGEFVNYVWYSEAGHFAVLTENKQTFKLIDTEASDPSTALAEFTLGDFSGDWTYSGITYDGHSTVMELELLDTKLATEDYVNRTIDSAAAGYYTKGETSSAVEISAADAAGIGGVSQAVSLVASQAQSTAQALERDFKPSLLSGEYEGGETFEKYFWTYEPDWFTMTNVGTDSQNIRMNLQWGGALDYSTDGGSTWTAYDGSSAVPVAAGSSIKFRAQLGSEPTRLQVHNSTTGLWKVSGNIMTLLDQTGLSRTVGENAFNGFSAGKVADASKLRLPATTLAGSCYYEMFRGCTALTAVPDELPAQTVPQAAYSGMFYQCTALKDASNLRFGFSDLAADALRFMFYRCTSLTVAPEIPNHTAVFSISAQYVFGSCPSLQRISVKFTAWPSSTLYWVDGVGPTGYFYCPVALGTNETIGRSPSRCPEGWIVVNV